MTEERTQREWRARERELLETTNRYLERAREAERQIKALKEAYNGK